jgi:hypothetical protein
MAYWCHGVVDCNHFDCYDDRELYLTKPERLVE